MWKAVALCCVCVVWPSATAAAAEWHITPMVGLTFRGNTSIIDPESAATNTHPQLGGSVALVGRGIFGAEAITSLTPGFFQAGKDIIASSRSFALMGNAFVTLPQRITEYSLRPYVSGGVGLLRVTKEEPPTRNVFPLNANFAGLNIGGGAVGFLSAHTGVRFDFRYYSTLHSYDLGGEALGTAHLRYLTLSVGVVLRR
jgi:hypothetical protein